MDKIYENIASRILQFIEIPPQQKMYIPIQYASNGSEYVQVNTFTNCRLISKAWYKYEHSSRCKCCSGRYIFNKKRIECFRCKHVRKTTSIPPNIIWVKRKATIHKLLTHSFCFSGKKDHDYIWGKTPSITGWISTYSPGLV